MDDLTKGSVIDGVAPSRPVIDYEEDNSTTMKGFKKAQKSLTVFGAE